MKDFFQKYPSAKPLWKVGDKTWLHHAREAAEMYAAQTGLLLEEVQATAPKKAKADKKEVSDVTE
jgi:hypothetical protein